MFVIWSEQTVRPDFLHAVYIDGENLVETRHFYYNEQWQLLEFHDGNEGQRKRQYVWGDRYVDDLILRDRDTNNDGTLEERLYAMQDPNWNVIAIAGTDGTVARRFSYAAYGKPEYRLANFTTISSNNAYYWDTFYTGRWYEEDYYVRLYHYRNRFYHAELGRFVNRDPIEYGGGDINLYRYVGNSPLNQFDPMGQFNCSASSCMRGCAVAGAACTVACVGAAALNCTTKCWWIPWPGNAVCVAGCMASHWGIMRNCMAGCGIFTAVCTSGCQACCKP